jgi:hypothetical protein
VSANARVVIRKGAMEELARSDGVAHALVGRAQSVQQRAQGNAPVSASGSHGRQSGYLRSNIRIKYAKDDKSAYADVVTTARTPAGFPYGRLQEQRHPYLKPAIE